MSRQREASLQKTCHGLMVRYADKHVLFHSIPNEQKCSPRVGKALNDMGRKAGTPDYIIISNGRPVYIEFKCDKDALGKKTYQTKEQKQFEAEAKAARVSYHVVRSVEGFLDACYSIAQLTHVSVTAGGAIKVDRNPFGVRAAQ